MIELKKATAGTPAQEKLDRIKTAVVFRTAAFSAETSAYLNKVGVTAISVDQKLFL